MTYALGIDVGTTFTAAALWRDGRAETVPLGDRANTVPSVLFLRDDGEWLVGEAAERRAVAEPARVAREFKRRAGDPVPVLLGGTSVTPQALMAQMIAWVVRRVSEREGEPPARVALTCPADWGDYRRALVTRAAASAGLPSVHLVTEPVGAAIFYASQQRVPSGALVGVYDLGGGTFDAAVLRKTGEGFELVGQPTGDDTVGGIDFDQVVLDHVAEALGPRWTGLDLADRAVLSAMAQVRANAVVAKEALSSDLEVGIPVILPGVTRNVRLTRVEFEERIRAALESTIDTFRQAVASAGIMPADLHAVLLVGGSSRIPLVSELVAGGVGAPVALDAHPKFAVCLGAAIDAAGGFGTAPALREVLVHPTPVEPEPVTPEPEPVTPEPLTPEPLTPEPVTPEPVTPEPVTPEPLTPEPVTPEPLTPEPLTPEPLTPEPVTPEPVTPEPLTPEPLTPEPLTPEPVTPEPVTPEPARPVPARPRVPAGGGEARRRSARPAWLLPVAASVAAVALIGTAILIGNLTGGEPRAVGGTAANTTLAPGTSVGPATSASTTTTTVALPEGVREVLLADDFSDPASKWPQGEQAAGSIRIADGGYRFHAALAKTVMQAPPGAVRVTEPSVRLDVSVRWLGGATDAGYGVYCRKDRNTDSMYKLHIQADGGYVIDKRLRGRWLARPLASGSNPTLIKRGGVNRLVAVCSSERDGGPVTLSLSVDGQLLRRFVDRRDPIAPSGGLGLLTTTADEVPLDVSFDDFALYAL